LLDCREWKEWEQNIKYQQFIGPIYSTNSKLEQDYHKDENDDDNSLKTALEKIIVAWMAKEFTTWYETQSLIPV
jgi:hypothetical protein